MNSETTTKTLKETLAAGLLGIGFFGPWIYSIIIDFYEGKMFWAFIHFILPPLGWFFGVYDFIVRFLVN